MTSTVRYTEGPPRLMGKVTTRITIMNRLDEAAATRGQLPPSAVRSITIEEMLVDTGAGLLSLPSPMIRQLGLELRETIDLVTANGVIRTGLYRDATIEVEGRSGTFDCIELPDGSPPLLGVIALENLGLELDLKHRRLTVLPVSGRESHFTA